MRAIRVRPGEQPVIIDLPKGFREIQKEVGGLFALVSLEDRVDAFANDEGIILGMPFNIMLPTGDAGHEVPICGPVVVLASDDEGESIGLTEEQAAKWLSVLAAASRVYVEQPEIPF